MIPWWTRITLIFLCCFMAWLFSSCSTIEETIVGEDAEDEELWDETKDYTASELYNRAADTFAAGKFKDAVKQFEEVERQHPYDELAKKAQIMAGYSAYRGSEYDEAIVILERFVKLYPGNERAAYAYYLRALSYYDRITDIGRDQKMTEDAREALRDVVSRFPGTDYERDARIKLDLTEDHLAGKEMHIGRYYQERDEYLAAINRFRHVIEHFQTTSHTPEALHRLVECYLRLGVKAEAKKYASVLGYNYPGSQWYEYSYKMMKGDVDPEDAKTEGWLEMLTPNL